jgi:hypothetical protein
MLMTPTPSNNFNKSVSSKLSSMKTPINFHDESLRLAKDEIYDYVKDDLKK